MTKKVCPECGAVLEYVWDGSADPRWVCTATECDYWGLG